MTRVVLGCGVLAALLACAHAAPRGPTPPAQGGSMTAGNAESLSLAQVAVLEAGGQHLAVSADGTRVAVGAGAQVVLVKGLVIAQTLAAPSEVDRLRFLADGKTLIAGAEVVELATATFAKLPALDTALAHGLAAPPPGGFQVRHVDSTPDGADVIAYVESPPPRGAGRSGGSGARVVWMTRAREVLDVPWTGDRFAITALAAGSQFVIAGTTRLLVWNRKTRAKVGEFPAHTFVIRDIAFSADGKLVASVGNDHECVVTETTTWKPVAHWKADDGDTVGVAFDPTRAVIATTGQDKQVKLWTADGMLLASAPLAGEGNALAFSADGSKLYAVTDDNLYAFDVKAAK